MPRRNRKPTTRRVKTFAICVDPPVWEDLRVLQGRLSARAGAPLSRSRTVALAIEALARHEGIGGEAQPVACGNTRGAP